MKKALWTWLMIGLGLTAMAQPSNERVEALKISFITQELDLSPEEAQKFWPVYNEFQAKLDVIREERNSSMPRVPREFDNLSDKQLAASMEQMFALEQQELNLKREYHARFMDILPIRKVGQLYLAEQRFKIKLLNEIKKRKENGPGAGRPLRR